jgi:hypothetical protein
MTKPKPIKPEKNSYDWAKLQGPEDRIAIPYHGAVSGARNWALRRGLNRHYISQRDKRDGIIYAQLRTEPTT